MKIKSFWVVIKNAGIGWSDDNASMLAAALSFYTFFSLAPLLLIAVAIAGFVLGEAAVRGNLMGQISGLVGPSGAKIIEDMLQNAWNPATGKLAAIIGIVTLVVGASAVFIQLQQALNMIWKVSPEAIGGGIIPFIKKRLLSFGLVVSMGFLLLVSLLASAALAVAANYISGVTRGLAIVGYMFNFVLSMGIITVLFALIFKVLPDIQIAWYDVWTGALVTAVLFSIGKFFIGLYLGNSGVSSTYGAAASVVVVLLWIYYSSQILLFGAEFTKHYANMFGSQKVPGHTRGEKPELAYAYK